MARVKIFGAGSIGNHLAQASRRHGWDVTIVDLDPKALERTKNETYPKRYGAWDPDIKLFTPDAAPKGGYDVIFIGTPPHVRLDVATAVLKEESPKVLQLEKPLCGPLNFPHHYEKFMDFCDELKYSGAQAVVGYEYVLGEGAQKAARFINNPAFGEVQTLEVAFRENWRGIFDAHPWLSGPADSYLGYWMKGGGASGEHSHAIHFWQYFANLLDLGHVWKVSGAMQMVNDGKVDYDSVCYLNVETDAGFVGRIVQDVVTDPPRMSMRIQRERASVEWARYAVPGKGTIIELNYGLKDDKGVWNFTQELLSLKRPDDFYPEICHIADILDGGIKSENSSIGFHTGARTIAVVTAAHIGRIEDCIAFVDEDISDNMV